MDEVSLAGPLCGIATQKRDLTPFLLVDYEICAALGTDGIGW